MKKLNVPDNSSKTIVHPLLASVIINSTSEVPLLGAVVNTWRDTVAQRKEQKLYEFLHEVAYAINDLAVENPHVVDVEHLQSDEFTSTLATVAQVSMSSSDEKKRRYLTQFITNYSKGSRPDIELAQIYQNLLLSFSGAHMVVLEKIASTQSKMSEKDLKVLSTQPYRREALTAKDCEEGLGLKDVVVGSLIASLEANGLLFRATTSDGSGGVTEILIIRPLGRSFIDYLTGGDTA